VLILAFLLLPIAIIVPLSFNAEPYFSFPMPGFSGRWYREVFASQAWMDSLRNSLIIAGPTVLLATTLGTLAALGLTLERIRFKTAVLALLVAPIMVPHIIIGLGLFFLYARIGIVYSYLGMILAHTTLATPFVVLIVSAALANFNTNLMRAALSLGAHPVTAFRRVMLPLILPGVIGGAVLAFVVSFDDVIVALLLSGPGQKTLPRQIWSGVNESVSPVIMAAATLLVLISAVLMSLMELLRRRGERLALTGAARPVERQ
jgi:putative spermidine/putrescine transport system permease protein